MDEQRNLIIAVAIAIAVMLAWETFITGPARQRELAERAATQATTTSTETPTTPGAAGAPSVAGPAPQGTREDALAASERVQIVSPEVVGSISLTGARFDDVKLTRYRQTIQPDSDIITLLSPSGGPDAYYSYLGWTGDGFAEGELPGPSTKWRLASGGPLTPQAPITLEYRSPGGLTFERKIAIDDHFMFTVTDRVINQTGKPATLRPYAAVVRFGTPKDLVKASILHEGPLGMFDNSLITRTYERLRKESAKGEGFERRSTSGWLGITDKYWLAAVIPDPKPKPGADGIKPGFDGRLEAQVRDGAPVYQTSWVRDPVTIPDGEGDAVGAYVFAGAKRAELLRDYSAKLGIHRFVDAIDWGQNFWFLTKPFFFVLEYFAQLVGNFGVAILLLVVALKAITFPLANMSFKSMARMKQLQPKVKELQERFKGDPERLQKEMMALYQREKVNPLAGCIPALVQIPIFYALYKTLFVTIEMRHAPFFGWIRDLSAPDPTNIWNLFGLLPFDPSHLPILGAIIGGTGFLALGVWPLLYGLTMAAMQTLSPPPPDPTQQKVFAFMPWIFMFILGKFAVGLLIYYVWNNILSFSQQYFIMRRQGVETPIGTFVSKRFHQLRTRLAPRS